MLFRVITSLSLILFLAHCGKKSESESTTETGTLQITMKNTGKPATSALNLAAAATDFRNSSIASGAPDQLTIYITKMALKNDQSTKTIFSDTSGKAITIKSSKVDISQLFANYACVDKSGVPVTEVTECPCGLDDNKKAVAKDSEGKCPDSGNDAVAKVQVDTGTFTSLDIDFQVRAKVKGCVSGTFSTVNSTSAATQGSRIYCTQSSYHTFQATPGAASASSFEVASSSAQEVDYQLPKANELYSDATKTFTASYPIKDGIKIDTTSSPTLTFAIDTNRMLRFYNQNISQEPNPGMSKTRSYFFNSVFEESSFAFVGRPGDVRGFQWWTDACSGTETATRTCTGSTTVVAGWMTVIKDADGKPLVVGLMPDDDNALTVIKGSNKSSAGIDSAAFAATGNNYNVSYSLDANNKGKLYNINIDAAVNSSQTTTFSGFQSYYGSVYLIRKL